MPIHFRCESGRSYDLEDENAGRTIRCLGCEKSITVSTATASEPPSAVTPNPPATLEIPDNELVFPTLRSQGRETPSRVKPPRKREFNLTDLAIIGGFALMMASLLWYFIGYRWFGGDRHSPAGAMFLAGLTFLFQNIIKDMDGRRN